MLDNNGDFVIDLEKMAISAPTPAAQEVVELDLKPKLEDAAKEAIPAYPPISSLPLTSDDRLNQADARPAIEPFPEAPIAATSLRNDADATDSTVLYLAYGSNLHHSTFQGRRGIRPISKVNVSAPSLRLIFDLVGFPYAEPCFANTALRKIPKIPKDPPEIPKLPPNLPNPPDLRPPPGLTVAPIQGHAHGDPVWDKGLVGVVYEVTSSDFAKIIASEGGGYHYKDILTPCIPLPPNAGIPERPGLPDVPRPFLAHTLFAPSVPKKGGNDDDNPAKAQASEKIPPWLAKLLAPYLLRVERPDPDYAQPTKRYLDLMREGAKDHDLPGEYQTWLQALQPYTVTTRGQKIGKRVFTALFFPLVLPILFLNKRLSDEKGRAPVWLAIWWSVVAHAMWILYDNVFRHMFGDGERTIPDKDSREVAGSGYPQEKMGHAKEVAPTRKRTRAEIGTLNEKKSLIGGRE